MKNSIVFIHSRIKIGGNIRSLRKVNGVTINQLSVKTGISVKMLLEIENGEKDYSIIYLFKIAEVLDPRMEKILKI